MRFNEFNIINEFAMPSDLANVMTVLGGMKGNSASLFGGDDAEKSAEPTTPTSPTSPMSRGNITGITNKVMVNQVSDYLKSKMDDNHRLGILTNIQAESGFNSGAIGDNKTSGGLFQHHADRFAKLTSALGKSWATNWQGQIDFALSEDAGIKYLSTKFSSPDDASKWWTINFEVPADKYAKASSRTGLLKNFA